MLALLGNEKVPAKVSDDEGTAIGYFATRQGSQIAILVYSSADKINQSGVNEVILQWRELALSDYHLTHFVLDDVNEMGNPFLVWEQQGAPEPKDGKLTLDHLEAMAAQQELHCLFQVDGSEIDPAGYSMMVNLPSVHLVLLTRKTEKKPIAPKKIWSRCYPGLDGRMNRMIRWEGASDRQVFRFKVLGSDKLEGPYQPLHGDKTILVDNGFLHRDVHCSPYFYKIAVYGYGDNKPAAESQVHIAGE